MLSDQYHVTVVIGEKILIFMFRNYILRKTGRCLNGKTKSNFPLFCKFNFKLF